MSKSSGERLDELLGLVRAAYIGEMRARLTKMTGKPSDYGAQGPLFWDGDGPDSLDSRGRNVQNAWPKVVRTALAADVDPVWLVRAAFRVHPTKPPTPHQICSPSSVAACQNWIAREGPSINARLEAALAHVFREVGMRSYEVALGWLTSGAAVAHVIMSPATGLSPLEATVSAHYLGRADLVGALAEPASRDYRMYEPFMNDCWRELVPPVVKELADWSFASPGRFHGRTRDRR